MKILNKILLFTLLIVILSSCEDRLNQINPNTPTVDDFWQSPEDFDLALNATYSGMQFRAIWGRQKSQCIMRGDLCGTEDWYAPWLEAKNLSWNSSSEYVRESWSQPYIGILRANQVIYYLEKSGSDAGLLQNEMDQIEAQARFIRAFLYFELVKNYNGAVVHDVFTNDDEDLRKEFVPRDDVLDRIIYPDLYFAANNLPIDWQDPQQLGRITAGASVALLGKVYLHQAEWDSAAKYLGLIINSGLYSLADDQMDNFTEEGEFNSESIFEIGFSDGPAPGVSGQRTDDVLGDPGAEGHTMASAYASLYCGGYNTVMPTYWLQELFTAGDSVDMSNSNYIPGRKRSNRTYGSIAMEAHANDGYYYGDTTGYNYTTNEGPKLNIGYGQGSKVKKYTNWYRYEFEDATTDGRVGINYRNIRLADVYLMYAEALLESGSSDMATILGLLDEIRDRACTFNMTELLTLYGGIPKFDDSPFANENDWYEIVDFTPENVLHHIRMVERPLELCFEGFRWHDLVRWGIVQEVLEARRAEEISIMWILANGPDDRNIAAQVNGAERIWPLYISQHVRPDFDVAVQNYRPGTPNQGGVDYFMIPSIEEESNNDLYGE